METLPLPLLDFSAALSKEDTFDDFCLSVLSPLNKTSAHSYLSFQDLPEKRVKPVQASTCHCKQSRCLKMYCECFASNLLCGPNCGCKGCKNKPRRAKLRLKAVAKVLRKNPRAFFHEGCNCRKSGCQKNYCECFHDGRKCRETCNCEGCKNFE